MSALADSLAALKAYLSAQSLAVPSTSGTCICELPARCSLDARGRPRISKSALLSVSAYEPRFETLMNAVYAWMNVSCWGLWQDCLVVGIELLEATSPRFTHTSVNYAGPPRRVIACEWNVSEALSIE